MVNLAVELWPDYDEPSMLVLLTGELPAGVGLPATVSVPFPESATMNAVARFDATGALFSDVEYSVQNGVLTITTPSPRFRVEYYDPYQVDGDTHSYRFVWSSGLFVEAVTPTVQQPAAATSLITTPTHVRSELRNDNLTYYVLPTRSVAPGEELVVEVQYEMPAPQLSAVPLTAPPTSQPSTTTDASPATDTILMWVLGIVGVLALLGVAYFLGRGRAAATQKTSKPRPVRSAKSKAAPRPAAPPAPEPPAAAGSRFCHQCGNRAEADDVFCRNCGTKLKP